VTPFPPTAASRRAGRLVAGVAFCLYLTTAGGGLASSDAVMTYEVTKNLITHGSVAASYDVKNISQLRGVDGRVYSPFGIGQSIVNVPFYVAAQLAQRAHGGVGGPDTLGKAAVALGNTVVASGLVWVTFLFAWRLSGDMVAASRTAFALGFGTLLWPYSKFGFNAPLTTWCLLAGVYAVWLGVRLDRRRSMAWGGVWLSCAFLTRHEMAIACAVVAVWVVAQSREHPRKLFERLVWLGAPLAAAAAFWLWYNVIRFGDPFNPGYLNDPTVQFNAPILQGMYGLLFSPGRSIFVYSPLTIVGLAALVAVGRRDRAMAVLFAGLTLSLLLFYSSLSSWDGGRSYGPRYLVPALPFLVLPMVWWLAPGRGLWPRAIFGLVLVSVIVQLPGVLVDFSKVSVAYARENGNVWETRTYTWKESGIVLNARAALHAVPANVGYLVRGERPVKADPPGNEDEGDRLQPPAPKTESDLSRRFAFSVDFWWLYLFYLGAVPAWLAVALAAALVAASGLMFSRLSGVIRSAPRGAPEGAVVPIR
jgi:hypothetical protein